MRWSPGVPLAVGALKPLKRRVSVATESVGLSHLIGRHIRIDFDKSFQGHIGLRLLSLSPLSHRFLDEAKPFGVSLISLLQGQIEFPLGNPTIG